MKKKRTPTHHSRSPTLGNVAEAAGVSTATVSRVINKPDAVRPEMRRRVQDQIDALGYVPDGAARALASRRTKTVGAVIPTLASAIFADGMDGFETELGMAGYTLLLATSGYDAGQEVKHVTTLIERGVDGILLVGKDHDAVIFDLLDRRHVPYVITWAHVGNGVHPSVGFDNAGAAYRMAGHLLELGHTAFAMIAGITDGNDRAIERVQGTREALAAQGLVIAPDCILERDYDIAAGREAARQLMCLANPPTAIICGNDVLAVGAVLECAAAGIDVPGQVSIVGFDDLPLAAHLTPSLTTMHVPSEEMGRRAASYLMATLNGKETPSTQELNVELIVRGTSGPPPT